VPVCNTIGLTIAIFNKKAMPSQGEPRDAAVNVDTYRPIEFLQRRCAVSLPQHGFLAGLCLQT